VEVDNIISHDVVTAKSGEHRLPACWLESLAVASRPLQRRRAEMNLNFRLISLAS